MADAHKNLDDRSDDWLEHLHEAIVADRDSSGLEAAALSSAGANSPEDFAALQECLQLVERVRLRQSSDNSTPANLFDETLTFAQGDQVRRIGRFEIIRDLGRGGHGIVFLARDPALGRQIALKVPRPEMLLSPGMRRRFLREAHAAARLSHPNIVAVHEVGDEATICYIAADYCPGESLHAFLRSRTEPLSPRVAAMLCAELASAVQYAHDHGVLHRDIKPGNVLLSPRPRRDTEASTAADACDFVPKLTDFGLARVADYEAEHTKTGALLGTPAYMAPEQARGQVAEVGPVTDVYGLGCVLYEMLTGRPAFSGITDLDTLHQVITQNVVPPRRLRPDIPADLEAICLCALAKNPRKRYCTATALSQDLQRYLAGRSTLIRPLSKPARMLRWVKRRPAVSALIAVSVAALATIVVGTIMYDWQLRAALADARQHASSRQALAYARDIQLAQSADERGHVQERDQMLNAQLPQPDERDFREFAWHQLGGKAPRCLATLRGHVGDVYAVAFSPAVSLVATTGKDATVRLWDLDSGKQLDRLAGGQGELGELVFFDSGRRLAAAGDDGAIRIWDVPSRKLVRVLDAQAGNITALAAFGTGTTVASGCRDGRVRLWNGLSGELLWATDAYEFVESLAISPDGAALTAGYAWMLMRTWDIGSGEMLWERDERIGGSSTNVAYAAGGGVAVAAERNLRCRVFRPDGPGQACNDVKTFDLSQREGTLHGLSISPVDNSIALGTRQGTIYTCRPDGQTERVFVGHAAHVWKLAFSPNGRLLASASQDGTARIWDLESRTSETFYYPGRSQGVFERFSISADGANLATLTTDGRVYQWDRASGSVISMHQPCESGLFLAHAPNDDLICVAASGETVHLSAGAAQPLVSASLDLDNVVGLGRGTHLFAARQGADGVAVFDARDLSQQGYFQVSQGIRGLAMANDGSRIAVVTAAARPATTVEIWQTAPLQKECTLTVGRSRSPGKFIFSNDGRQLIGGGDDEPITVWDIDTRSVLKHLSGPANQLMILAASHNGRTLATVSGRNARRVQLWDLDVGIMLSELKIQPGLDQLEFTPDDRALIAMGVYRSRSWLVEWSTQSPWHDTADAASDDAPRQPMDRSSMVRDQNGLLAVLQTSNPDLQVRKSVNVHRLFGESITRRELRNAIQGFDFTLNTDGRTVVKIDSLPPSSLPSTQIKLEIVPLHNSRDFELKSVQQIEVFDDTNSSGEFEPETDTLLGAQSPVQLDVDTATLTIKNPSMIERAVERPLDKAFDCATFFRLVGDYARREGFAAGYPTFNFSPDTKPSTAQIVLLRGLGAKRVSVTAQQLDAAGPQPLFEFASQGELLTASLQSIDAWGTARNYSAAIPTLYFLSQPHRSPRYELVAFTGANYQRTVVPFTKLQSNLHWKRTFQLTHEAALDAGFQAGLPTFNPQDDGIVCIFVKAPGAEVRNVPLGQLDPDRELDSNRQTRGAANRSDR